MALPQTLTTDGGCWKSAQPVVQAPILNGGASGCSFGPDPVSNRNRWKLVWCHERSRKDENRRRREIIHKEVTPHGGHLLTLKKATHFMKWLQRRNQTSRSCTYVLVTDWREAQPLMKGLLEMSDFFWPSLTVVLCSCDRQLMKSANWAQTISPTVGPICSCTQDQIPTSVFHGLIQKCFAQSLEECRLQVQHRACEASDKDCGSNLLKVNDDVYGGGDCEISHGQVTRTPSEADVERDDPSEATDDSDEHLQSTKDYANMPLFPTNMPAPVILVRGQDNALMRRECNDQRMKAPFLPSCLPWTIETNL